MTNLFEICDIDAKMLQDYVSKTKMFSKEYEWIYGVIPEVQELNFHYSKYYHPNFPKVALTRYQLSLYTFLLTINYNFFCNSFLYLMFHSRNKHYVEFMHNIGVLRNNGMIKYRFKVDNAQHKDVLLVSVYDQFGNNLNNLIKTKKLRMADV